MSKVEIYTQPGCPYCVHAVSLLRSKGIEFQEINAPHGTAEREESIRRSGRRTVPQTFVDGKGLGGCDDLMALDRAGRLDALLGKV
ncbi:glutaredoxin 3 [Gluconobacter sphaericus]|uniref:Glutaredoxin n=1 Tax=Gluconobacter sphaericus NBRC 12467 TaxID=1307951 RepID=A0AA37SJQ6_9PROT|nr:glutaredoxin 3 [Gluconobacter sphaericus]MBF0885317.1 glutaredoxin 3 [Gluconobacter sphaericus]MBS1084983.1 glutaredoxin 3 [Gluconobacter sphaericus]MBS1096168.1 glutaredoxin 3 [Gluconobacter sphaericus]MBS1098799.1 glutaredoxin 3 [Gluconobacter sphaericus]QQX91123.1 glutaredoxin 3 [Gluconobacter sphaericus]